MTAAAATTPTEALAGSGGSPPAGWQALRSDSDLQFAPVTIPEIPLRKPHWFQEWLLDVLDALAELFAPLGRALGTSWWWLQWAVLGLVVLGTLVLLVRLITGERAARGQRAAGDSGLTDNWRPDTAATLALLDDADRLAAEGRFAEAVRLLLQRSVGQIAAARPGLVEPSSTARELAALPALPETARTAFGVIAQRVERSLFALRALDRADWEAARNAYAEFALARLGQQGRSA
ncbi:hypothetical protein C0V72_09535 [Porphyrobacter sp. TH134]|nr:hypothetical protein C0V72_09535 [Porphyrobacter sp. TH134]